MYIYSSGSHVWPKKIDFLGSIVLFGIMQWNIWPGCHSKKL